MLEETKGRRTQLLTKLSLGNKTTCKVNVVFVRSGLTHNGNDTQSISSVSKRRVVKSCSTPWKVQMIFSHLAAAGKIYSKRRKSFNKN